MCCDEYSSEDQMIQEVLGRFEKAVRDKGFLEKDVDRLRQRSNAMLAAVTTARETTQDETEVPGLRRAEALLEGIMGIEKHRLGNQAIGVTNPR